MWIVFLIFAVTFFVCAARVRPRPGRGRHADDGFEAVELPPAPRSLEGALVAQLARSDITRWQYTRAMEQLAERDEVRHPLSVPPEVG
jgi:hypothetical protein